MISIVIAAYNEEQRIGKSLLKVRDYLAGQGSDYEIIIVDDGSTDNTKQVVDNYTLEIKNLKIITIFAILGEIIIFYLFGLMSDYWMFFLLFICLGLLGGILYGISLKLILILNVERGTSKYSSYLESIVGLFTLTGPILSGVIATYDLNLSFYIMALTLFGLFIIYIPFFYKIKKKTI